MSYFSNLLHLLKLEREEDQLSFEKQVSSLSIPEKRISGLLWYPVAIKGTDLGRGDYLNIEVERTSHWEIPHQLRFGNPVTFFSNHDSKNYRIEGIITHLSANTIKINSRTEELPDWCKEGKLGVELLFDNNSYDEMQEALMQAQKRLEKEDNNHLIKILSGEKLPSYNDRADNEYYSPFLNRSQHNAINKILTANELAIIHGPPGTGKTTTLVEAIYALQNHDKQQILVVAPSNTAVDLLSAKLTERGLNVVRIGNPVRVSQKLTELTLDSKIAAHKYSKEIKQLKKQAAEFKNMGHKYKRNFGKSEREQRKALFDEAHKILKQADVTERFVINDILDKADVITATLVGANHYTICDRKYETLVIDEAGQALEPACWIPLLKTNKVIFAGDHQQLSPTIKSKQAENNSLGVTLLEKCIMLYPESVVLLEEQYRMNKQIMDYPSSVFYQNKLKAHLSVAHNVLFKGDIPVEFIDTAGCGFDEKVTATNISNPDEAVFLLKHLTLLLNELKDKTSEQNKVAIITPYREQVELFHELLPSYSSLFSYKDNITINTVDSFQGQEKDIVYIGLTRSNANNNIGFLSDIRRMNVAITRAKKKLVIIGDSVTLSKNSFYSNLIAYTEQCGGYKSAWEFAEAD